MNNEKIIDNGQNLKLYRFALSGHCHRVELMLSLLNIPYDVIEIKRDGSNEPEGFHSISPMGQVPVIDDNGIQLADSNAILVYLLRKYNNHKNNEHYYEWMPEDPVGAAQVQRWFSIAAGELVSGPAIARFSKVFNVNLDYETAKKKAIALFKMMNNTLSKHDFLISDSITVADIALYTYVAHAPEGGLHLHDYPNVQSWLKRIESQDRFISMESTTI